MAYKAPLSSWNVAQQHHQSHSAFTTRVNSEGRFHRRLTKDEIFKELYNATCLTNKQLCHCHSRSRCLANPIDCKKEHFKQVADPRGPRADLRGLRTDLLPLKVDEESLELHISSRNAVCQQVWIAKFKQDPLEQIHKCIYLEEAQPL